MRKHHVCLQPLWVGWHPHLGAHTLVALFQNSWPSNQTCRKGRKGHRKSMESDVCTTLPAKYHYFKYFTRKKTEGFIISIDYFIHYFAGSCTHIPKPCFLHWYIADVCTQIRTVPRIDSRNNCTSNHWASSRFSISCARNFRWCSTFLNSAGHCKVIGLVTRTMSVLNRWNGHLLICLDRSKMTTLRCQHIEIP